MRMPSGWRPRLRRLISLRDGASRMTNSLPERSETRASLPSEVNLRRLERLVWRSSVCTTFFAVTSMIETVPSPEFAAIGRNVATFGTFADGNHGGAPAGGIGAALKHSDGVRTDVGSEEQRAVLREDKHVRAVLADAEEPVELIGGGIVAGDEFVVFGGEPDLAIGEGDAVRAAQSAEINAAEFLLGEQINHRKSVAWGAGAVVGDEGEFAVVGGGDFVRSFAGGDLRQKEKGQHEIGDDGFSDCSGEVHGWVSSAAKRCAGIL